MTIFASLFMEVDELHTYVFIYVCGMMFVPMHMNVEMKKDIVYVHLLLSILFPCQNLDYP